MRYKTTKMAVAKEQWPFELVLVLTSEELDLGFSLKVEHKKSSYVQECPYLLFC